MDSDLKCNEMYGDISRVIAIIATLSILHVCPSTAQTNTQANKCIEDFSNALIKCVTDTGLTRGNFLWFVTNGTSSKSEQPTDPDSYKPKICELQQRIGACTFQSVATIINSTACVGTSAATNQQDVIRTQLNKIFGTYDAKCMHPCRNTLATELRNCYTESGLDPKLFLSNSSNGAVVGSNDEQIAMFCGAKGALVSCMQRRVDACPEAPQILRAIDLDIPSFEKGVSVLCKHPKVYLHGLACFADSTNEVDRCQQKEAQSLIQLDLQAREGNWSESKFFEAFCEIAIEQVECDLKAWGNKNHEACVEAVIGLRRELECELVAPQCNVNPKQISELDHTCHPEKFMKTKRENFSKDSSSASTVTHTALPLTALVAALYAASLL
ncbi:hypothetical protein ElyMa_000321900 [Elysia marginata]|uniref:Uncharacterized protein n=1 Tax=Elysia marginata TaxID=1093978 RepID=A0AAV4FA09_9GAST|nr:hypothetical protein ElyMa_000321900 [Elysia marginata]